MDVQNPHNSDLSSNEISQVERAKMKEPLGGKVVEETSERFSDEESPELDVEFDRTDTEKDDIPAQKYSAKILSNKNPAFRNEKENEKMLNEHNSPEQSTKEPRERNQRFQDVHETGKWGNLSRTEVIIVFAVTMIVILGAAGGITYFFVSQKDTEDKPSSLFVGQKDTEDMPSSAPSFLPDIPAKDQLDIILLKLNSKKKVIGKNDIVNETDFYFSGEITSESSATLRAMQWVLNDEREPATDDPWLIYRYALAVLYYSFEGAGWINNENWLTKNHACEWYGLTCLPNDSALIEIDLASNNLTGVIPKQIHLLNDVRSLLLSYNSIGGKVPFKPLGKMTNLTTLYLNNNNLTGQYSKVIGENRVSTFYIQENNMIGQWPKNLCLQSNGKKKFEFFGLDCVPEVTKCFCCDQYNCY